MSESSSRSPIRRRRYRGWTANVVTWASSTMSQMPPYATTSSLIVPTRYAASRFASSSWRYACGGQGVVNEARSMSWTAGRSATVIGRMRSTGSGAGAVIGPASSR